MLSRVSCLFGVLYLGAAVLVAADNVIEGVVQLPPPTVERALDQRYRSNAESALTPSNPPAAVVYVDGSFPNAPGSQTTGVMAQKNILFAPDLIAVRVGQAVEFPNLDDTYHNVFSYSKAKRFDLGRYRKNEKPGTVVFDKPGVVTVHCEIHDRMHATILVLDTPYFQKTDTAGHYRLEGLPAGRFSLKAWVTEADVRVKEVTLTNGVPIHVDFPAK